MAEPTLVQVFGNNVTFSSDILHISITDLGLTAGTTPSAECLLAAILLKAKQAETSTNFNSNIDQSLYIDSGYSSFTNRTNSLGISVSYRVDQLTVNLAKLDSGATLDPTDY